MQTCSTNDMIQKSGGHNSRNLI